MINYRTVNTILYIVRRFDEHKIDAKELSSSLEYALLSDGWKLKHNIERK